MTKLYKAISSHDHDFKDGELIELLEPLADGLALFKAIDLSKTEATGLFGKGVQALEPHDYREVSE